MASKEEPLFSILTIRNLTLFDYNLLNEIRLTGPGKILSIDAKNEIIFNLLDISAKEKCNKDTD